MRAAHLHSCCNNRGPLPKQIFRVPGMIDAHLLAVVFSGLGSGAVLGAVIPTQTEKNIRRSLDWEETPEHPFVVNAIVFTALRVSLWLLVFYGVCAGLLNATDALPLHLPGDLPCLLCTWLVGGTITSRVRYLYWKHQDFA